MDFEIFQETAHRVRKKETFCVVKIYDVCETTCDLMIFLISMCTVLLSSSSSIIHTHTRSHNNKNITHTLFVSEFL